MFAIITANPIPFILAVIIGLITAWWIWGRAPDVDLDHDDGHTDAPPEPVKAAEIEPEAPAPAVAAAAAGTTTAEPEVPANEAVNEDGPKIAAAVGEPDDLTRIKGIGPKLNELCQSLGVQRFDQIAKWGAKDVAEVDQYLKIKGRIDRDKWVDQAKLLAAGKDDDHKAKFG